jgi:hypothetical protein
MKYLNQFLQFFKSRSKRTKPQDQWFIALKYREKDIFNLRNLVHIHAPKGHFWADPFVIEHQKKYYLFYEDYDYIKGVIGVAEIKGLTLRNPRTVLSGRKHMSFPAVFNHENQMFMTPECINSRKLYIYKATKFPDKWKKYALVALGKYEDPIIRKLEYGFEIWATEGRGQQRVFYAEKLEGPWVIIKKNENALSRSAGHFINDWRPVQDASKTYGGAIQFFKGNKIVKSIYPTWAKNIIGTHTFNISKKYIVIDGKRSFNNRIENERNVHVHSLSN